MINYNFTAVIQSWLDADPQDRDYAAGATILLQLDGNKIRYNNIIRNPTRYADILEAELRRHFDQRNNRPSEQQKQIIRNEAKKVIKSLFTEQSKAKQFKAGKRADHDSLPEDIKALYEKNTELRYKMQQLHLQIRTLIKSKKDCAPADLKDSCDLLKKYDIEYRKNWNSYDNFSAQ